MSYEIHLKFHPVVYLTAWHLFKSEEFYSYVHEHNPVKVVDEDVRLHSRTHAGVLYNHLSHCGRTDIRDIFVILLASKQIRNLNKGISAGLDLSVIFIALFLYVRKCIKS